MTNIVLVGFARSGKTTLANALADQWHCDSVDTDQQLMARYASEFKQSLSIRQIYLQQGEQFFRQWEYECLAALRSMQKTIIATGGGTMVAANNREVAKQLGKVVYLQMNFTTVLARLELQTWGPLTGCFSKLEKAQQIFADRLAFYEEIADLTIPVEDKEPMQLVQELLFLRATICDR